MKTLGLKFTGTAGLVWNHAVGIAPQWLPQIVQPFLSLIQQRASSADKLNPYGLVWIYIWIYISLVYFGLNICKFQNTDCTQGVSANESHVRLKKRGSPVRAHTESSGQDLPTHLNLSLSSLLFYISVRILIGANPSRETLQARTLKD